MSETGVVFNIQKFSIHDGPGIRTTVFLKGCPLRCKWCSNPESQSAGVEVLYDARLCAHCGHCAQVCPKGCFARDADGHMRREARDCVGCLACVDGCPARALSAEGRTQSVDEVFEICMQDLAFYEESGGGVTISGGEGMSQPGFVAALAEKLHGAGVSVAIETTGCVNEAVFRRLAPMFDLLLFDVKHYDCEAHRAGTGEGNEFILKNLRWAVENGLNILPRIPVIPGFNASLDDARGLAELLHKIGLRRAQLLPFHQMGERKYELLGREYSLKAVPALHPEDLEDYRAIFMEAGLDCFF